MYLYVDDGQWQCFLEDVIAETDVVALDEPQLLDVIFVTQPEY